MTAMRTGAARAMVEAGAWLDLVEEDRPFELALERDILVVEDDHDIREALSAILMDEGYRVAAAGNGLEALAQLREPDATSPDLILLDLRMPVMNGWEFRHEQRRDPILCGIPVLVLSAETGLREAANSIDAVGFIQKPIELEDLLGKVQLFC